jgi:hypothetical protein
VSALLCLIDAYSIDSFGKEGYDPTVQALYELQIKEAPSILKQRDVCPAEPERRVKRSHCCAL